VSLQPGDRLQRVGVAGEPALGPPRADVGGVEHADVAVGEQVLELVQRLQLRAARVGEDADVHVIVAGDVPLHRREDGLVGVLARVLQREDGGHLEERHAARHGQRAGGDGVALVVLVGDAQVVGERDPVELIPGEGVLEHHAEQRLRRLRVVGLGGVDVQIAGGPATRGRHARVDAGVGLLDRRVGNGGIGDVAGASGAGEGRGDEQEQGRTGGRHAAPVLAHPGMFMKPARAPLRDVLRTPG
jgi:hypothetical protein